MLQLKYGGVDIKCNGVNFKNVARIIMDENTIEINKDADAALDDLRRSLKGH